MVSEVFQVGKDCREDTVQWCKSHKILFSKELILVLGALPTCSPLPFAGSLRPLLRTPGALWPYPVWSPSHRWRNRSGEAVTLLPHHTTSKWQRPTRTQARVRAPLHLPHCPLFTRRGGNGVPGFMMMTVVLGRLFYNRNYWKYDKLRSCYVRITQYSGITKSSHSTAVLLEELMVSSLWTNTAVK